MSSFKNTENVHGVVCHVAKAEDRDKLINETVAKFGSIDILVSNAATNPVFGPMLEVNELFVLWNLVMIYRYLKIRIRDPARYWRTPLDIFLRIVTN